MSYIAVAIGGAGTLGYFAATGAANTQASSAAAANATQLSEFDVAESNEKPYLQAGVNALGQIQANMPAYNAPFTTQDFLNNEDPGYAFDLQQGQKALQNSAASTNGLVNAGTLASLNNYSQSMASNEYQNAFNRYQTQISNNFNRLASVAQLGQTGTQGANAAGANAANNISANTIGAGNAIAAGTVGGANAISNAVGQGVGAYNNNNLISALTAKSINSPGSVPGGFGTISEPSLGDSAGYGSGTGGAYWGPNPQLTLSGLSN